MSCPRVAQQQGQGREAPVHAADDGSATRLSAPASASASASVRFVDTVIVGSGPAALILSYLLSGHEPQLRSTAAVDDEKATANGNASVDADPSTLRRSALAPHPDPQLQAKLSSCFPPSFHSSSSSSPSSSSSSSSSRPLSAASPSLPLPLPPSLLDANVSLLTSHFHACRVSYSTQALPVNALFDTLLRPLADTEPGLHASCIEWRAADRVRVPHLVLGSSPLPGGQWQENPVEASWDIGTLSYADMLSLPGYGIEEHLRKREGHAKATAAGAVATEDQIGPLASNESAEFLRPSRRDVADYLATYPSRVGIADNIRSGTTVSGISRVGSMSGGFFIASHNLRCRNLVLASGTFSTLIPPRPALHPLLRLPGSSNPLVDSPAGTNTSPLLIVGSGFSAADLLITHLPHRKCIHIFKWDPDECVSPLRACHRHAYPEYAAIYRRMKSAAARVMGDHAVTSPPAPRRGSAARKNPLADVQPGDENYEGLPNTFIQKLEVHDEKGTAHVWLEPESGEVLVREISGLQYVIGRRGSLDYLQADLRAEILAPADGGDQQPVDSALLGDAEEATVTSKLSTVSGGGGLISGRTLRSKAEKSTEMAPGVFAIGSLLGDSLVRYAYGGCCVTAGRIVGSWREADSSAGAAGAPIKNAVSPPSVSPYSASHERQDKPAEQATENERETKTKISSPLTETHVYLANGHEHLDSPRRRQQQRPSSDTTTTRDREATGSATAHNDPGSDGTRDDGVAIPYETPLDHGSSSTDTNTEQDADIDQSKNSNKNNSNSSNSNSNNTNTREQRHQQQQQKQQRSASSWWNLKAVFETLCKEERSAFWA